MRIGLYSPGTFSAAAGSGAAYVLEFPPNSGRVSNVALSRRRESRRELLEMANLVERERANGSGGRFVYANCHLREAKAFAGFTAVRDKTA